MWSCSQHGAYAVGEGKNKDTAMPLTIMFRIINFFFNKNTLYIHILLIRLKEVPVTDKCVMIILKLLAPAVANAIAFHHPYFGVNSMHIRFVCYSA